MSTRAGYSGPLSEGPRTSRPGPHAGGLLPGMVCLAAAIAGILEQQHIRYFEAWGMAWVFDRVLGGSAYSVRDIVFHHLGAGQPFAVMVTGLCSSAVLFTPIMALAGVLFLMGRIRVVRLAFLGSIALLIVVSSNTLRYLMIAGAQQAWGQQGFDLMHHFLGSFVVIIGFVAAIIVLFSSARPTRGRRAR
ncbi:exosortase S [bacterium RCC_150]